MLLWAYATDGDSRPFLWLGPKSTDDASTMVLRHWLINKVAPTFPLPGIFFFDAWRIHPSLEIPLQLSAGLTAVDLTHDEDRPKEAAAQDTRHVDRLIRRHGLRNGGQLCNATFTSAPGSREHHRRVYKGKTPLPGRAKGA